MNGLEWIMSGCAMYTIRYIPDPHGDTVTEIYESSDDVYQMAVVQV